MSPRRRAYVAGIPYGRTPPEGKPKFQGVEGKKLGADASVPSSRQPRVPLCLRRETGTR